MTPASNRGYPELTPAVGYYLAGFVDGEGHFGIVRARKPSGTFVYSLIFAVHIRDDDTFMLERLRPEGSAPMERWWQEIRAVRDYAPTVGAQPSYEVEVWTLFDEPEELE